MNQPPLLPRVPFGHPGQRKTPLCGSIRKKKLRVSQSVFARLTNAAPQTIHAWEQGRAKPSGSALRVLHIFDEKPEIARELLLR